MEGVYNKPQFFSTKSKGAALRGYLRFVEEGVGMGRVPELTGGGLGQSLEGGPEWWL